MKTFNFTQDESSTVYAAVRAALELAEEADADATQFPDEFDNADEIKEQIVVLTAILEKLVTKQ